MSPRDGVPAWWALLGFGFIVIVAIAVTALVALHQWVAWAAR